MTILGGYHRFAGPLVGATLFIGLEHWLQSNQGYFWQWLASLPLCSFLITEHDLEVVFDLAETIIIMHQGQIILQGDRQTISNSPEVRRVYLGT